MIINFLSRIFKRSRASVINIFVKSSNLENACDLMRRGDTHGAITAFRGNILCTKAARLQPPISNGLCVTLCPARRTRINSAMRWSPRLKKAKPARIFCPTFTRQILATIFLAAFMVWRARTACRIWSKRFTRAFALRNTRIWNAFWRSLGASGFCA